MKKIIFITIKCFQKSFHINNIKIHIMKKLTFLKVLILIPQEHIENTSFSTIGIIK